MLCFKVNYNSIFYVFPNVLIVHRGQLIIPISIANLDNFIKLTFKVF